MDKKLIIRPSSLDSFLGCPWQWYNVFVLGEKSIPNARAAIGTSIHKGVETLWEDAIATGKKDLNKTKLFDAAIQDYQDNEKEADQESGLQYKDGEDTSTAQMEVIKGVEAFVDDIAPFTDIPKAVEKRFTVNIQHDLVEAVSGTIDYLGHDTIADVKTSARKITPASHKLQQSTYKYLAEANGETVKRNLIQGVILGKKKVSGSIDLLEPNVAQAKAIINNMLDTLDVYKTGTVDPKVLFRGNPKHYLCSDLYCKFRPKCPFVNGEV